MNDPRGAAMAQRLMMGGDRQQGAPAPVLPAPVYRTPLGVQITPPPAPAVAPLPTGLRQAPQGFSGFGMAQPAGGGMALPGGTPSAGPRFMGGFSPVYKPPVDPNAAAPLPYEPPNIDMLRGGN